MDGKAASSHTHDDRYYTESEINTKLNSKLNTSLKGSANGLAELDSNGKVLSSQLPSFVDDIVEGYLSGGKFYKESAHTTEITGETGKIYIDLTTNKTYRWSGSAFVVVSETLALGETSSTAYRGDKGKIAYDHSQSTHARTDATKVEKSSTNGNIKINGTETTVYTHPGGTNPHGTTKSDVGLGNVGNFKAVSTVASQGLTDTEKSNARANIGAGTSSFSGSYNDLTNKPTIPSVGNGTITIKQAGTTKGTFTTNQSGNTTIELTDNNTTYGVATQSNNGLESAADKKKLDGIATGAEVNQNAFSNVVVGSTTISADSKTDSLTLAGSNVTITPDANNDKVTIGITKANVTSALGYTPPTTDTNTWRGIQNNLTSDSTTDSLSAAQGKVLKGLVDGKAASSHTHDDRYYTESEVDSKLNSKANSSHTHTIANITNLQSTLDGKAASNHSHSSVNDIGNGSGTTFAYSKEGLDYGNYTWLAGWNSYELRAVNKNQFATASHTHHYAGSSSAGGSANSAVKLDTATAGSATQPVYFSGGKPVACSYTLGKSVPSNAVFTDTNTWRGIQDNLTSSSTSDSLSANQGRVLKSLVDGKAASDHTHNSIYLKYTTVKVSQKSVVEVWRSSSEPNSEKRLVLFTAKTLGNYYHDIVWFYNGKLYTPNFSSNVGSSTTLNNFTYTNDRGSCVVKYSNKDTSQYSDGIATVKCYDFMG